MIESKNIFILIPFIIWVVNSRRFKSWLPFIGLLLFFSLITEMVGEYLVNRDYDNHWVYNCFIVFDFTFLSVALLKISPKPKESRWIIFFSSFILLLTALNFLLEHSPIDEFATSLLLVMGGLLVIHSIWVILGLAKHSSIPLLRSASFWITLSPFFYFACFVPSFGLMMYFSDKNDDLADQLYEINDYLFIMRYLLILVGFVLALKKQPNAQRL